MLNSKKSIVDFYKNKNILITGATGLLGSSLVEKLLRSFPEVSKIYLLARKKNSECYEKRCNNYFDKMIFSEIKQININYKNRVIWVNGDLTAMNNLGISDRDLDMIRNEVNIVFHCAASVIFIEPLKEVLNKHLNATNDLLNIWKNGKKLDCFVYVSTIYSNFTSTQTHILDKLYPSQVDLQELLKLPKNSTNKEIQDKYKDLITQYSNTYVLSKNFTENLVNEFKNVFPVGIFRPGALLASAYEPFPYWIQGEVAFEKVLQEISKGYRFKNNPNARSCAVPVDLATNALIASAWDINNHCNRTGIYNYSCNSNPISFQECANLYADGHDPLELAFKRLEYRNISKNNPGKQNFDLFMELVSGFLNSDIIFENKHIQHLWNTMSDEEKKLLFFDINQINWRKYYEGMPYARIQD